MANTQIARLIARSEIDRVLSDWVHGLDEHDETLWLSAFHNDAVFEVDAPAAMAEGHEAILDWARGPWRFQSMAHITCAHQVDFIDDDHATGVGRGTGIFKLEDGTAMLTTGRLEDRYSKRDGVWRMSYRKVGIISQFRLTGATDLVLNNAFVETAA